MRFDIMCCQWMLLTIFLVRLTLFDLDVTHFRKSNTNVFNTNEVVVKQSLQNNLVLPMRCKFLHILNQHAHEKYNRQNSVIYAFIDIGLNNVMHEIVILRDYDK